MSDSSQGRREGKPAGAIKKHVSLMGFLILDDTGEVGGGEGGVGGGEHGGPSS